MRTAYSLAWWLLTPLALARLWWRGRKEPGYRQHVLERLGCYVGDARANTAQSALSVQSAQSAPVIWLHAVSVGETRAAQPLLEALLCRYPTATILLTHMTPTGRATGKAIFGEHGSRVVQAYLPYDTGTMVARFLRRFTPQICILMETEVWPNLIAQCARRKIPVALVNARLSQRSYKKAQRFARLIGEAARGMSCVTAQTEADAARIIDLGARNVHITGSIKFDLTVPPSALRCGAAMRAHLGARPVLLCASTREGEEAMILDAFQALADQVLLIIVPRHPQRFDEVAGLIGARGFSMLRRSALDESRAPDPSASPVQILLGDSMGEMFAYFAACDLVFIGGSLLPLGGHNLIEPCAVGKPVLIGEHTFNFDLITQQAISAGAALRVADAPGLMRQARQLLAADGQRDEMGRKALSFAQQHRGATERTMALLAALLPAG